MARMAFVSAAFVFVGGLLWSARIVFGASPWGDTQSGLLGADIVLLTSIAVVAILLGPGRWVRNLVGILGIAWVGLAAMLEIDLTWIVALAASGLGVAMALARPSDDWFAGDVKPDRVPAKATALVLLLLSMPAVVAVTAEREIALGGWILAGTSVALGWAYSRAIPIALWFTRFAVPVIGVAALIGLAPIPASVVAASVVLVVILAWSPQARLAASPLVPRRVSTVSILPEMVPPELMESAGYDRMGRPRDEDA